MFKNGIIKEMDGQFQHWMANQDPLFLDYLYNIYKQQPMTVVYNGPMTPITSAEIKRFDLALKLNGLKGLNRADS